MPSCWEEALSAVWIGLTGHYRLTYEDKAIEAEEQLTKLVAQLDRRQEALLEARVRCAEEARALRSASRRDRPKLEAKVKEYRRVTAHLDRLQKYKDTVGQHIDALQNTELNKTIIATLQESSKTLKSMGLYQGVEQAEAVIGDVHESMHQALELNNCLGKPLMGQDLITDEDIERELEEMLDAPSEREAEAEEQDPTFRAVSPERPVVAPAQVRRVANSMCE